jgi:hypothetical protein
MGRDPVPLMAAAAKSVLGFYNDASQSGYRL